MRTYLKLLPQPIPCDVCKLTCEPYMVHDKLWQSLFKKPRGGLCLRCLERRLHRKVRRSDFYECGTNSWLRWYTYSSGKRFHPPFRKGERVKVAAADAFVIMRWLSDVRQAEGVSFF